MFEALLQRILNRLFGKYLEGIDSKKLNLGIWSGRLIIENVRLRKQLFQLLGLPYEIAFSIIQKIIVVVPWKSLSSKPVEIVLDSLLAIVVSKEKEGWRVKDNKDVELILNDLNGYMNNYLKRLIDNEKSVVTQDKQKGYFDNTFIRALDNIQFSIRNIHLRFQDNITHQYSFGLTLESIEVFTCNEQGQKAFLDRTSVERSRDSLHKSVQLNNLGLYWKEAETNFLHKKSQPTVMTNYLIETIFRKNKQSDFNYLFMINSRSLLRQRSDEDFSGPRYQVGFQLEQLRIRLSKTIVQQIISFIEFRSEYTQRSITSTKLAVTPRFRYLLSKYYLHYESDQPDLASGQKSEFGHLLLMFSSQQIKQTTQEVVKEQYKNKIITKMIQKKKNSLLDEADINQIDGFMEKLARPAGEQKPLPNDYVYFHLGVNFRELSFFIIDDFKKNLFSITLFQIASHIRMSNDEQKYNFQIEDIKSQGKQKKDILWKDPGKKFLAAQVIQRKVGQQKAVLTVSSVQFLYDIRTIEQLKDFTQVKVQASLKNKAIDKVQELGSQVGKNIQNKKGMQLRITIDTPKVILLQGRRKWVIHFGNVFLHKEGTSIKAQLTDLKTDCEFQNKIFRFIPGFSVNIDSKDSDMNVVVSDLRIALDKVHFKSIKSLISTVKSNTSKTDIMAKSSKRALIFLRQKNWKKVLATICEGHIYFWQKKDFPLCSIRIRKVLINKDANRSNTILISDQKGNNYVIGFQDPAVMKQWLVQLQSIANIQIQEIETKNQLERSTELKVNYNYSCKVQIKSAQIILKYPDQSEWLRVQVIGISFLQVVDINGSHLSVSVNDVGIIIGEFKFLQKISQKEFLTIESRSIAQTSPIYEKKDNLIKAIIRSSSINYDPTIVIRLYQFFQNEQDLMPPAQKMFDQETMQKMSQQRILSQTQILFQGIDFVLINKKTNLPIAKMSIKKLDIKMSSYYYESIVQGKLGDMNIFDLTNYPVTVFEQNGTLIAPRFIWGSSNLLQNENMLEFKYVSLLEGSKKIVGDHYLDLGIKIYKAHLIYLHQPVIRIVDYLKVQLKGALSNPEFFDQYHGSGAKRKLTDYKEFIKKRQQTIYNRLLVWLGKERVKKSLQSPREMYMHIQLKQPMLTMMSNTNQGLKFKIEDILITNEFYYSSDRVISGSIKQVLCERYKFIFDDVTLQLAKGGAYVTEQSFNINLSLDMFYKQAQYRFISNEPLNLDSSEGIKMFVTPLYFSLTQEAYLQIQKVMKLNFGHEDGLDFLMVHDYIPPEPSGISVQLDFQAITLSLKDQKTSMAEFTVQFFRYSYKKSIAQEKQTVVNVASLEAKFLINEAYKQIISKRSNLKMSTSRRNLSVSMYKSSEIFQVPRRQIPREVSLCYKGNSSKYEEITKVILSDIVFIFEIEFILFLKRWSTLPPIQPMPKVYTKVMDKSPSVLDLHKHQNTLSIRLSRVILSFYIPRSEKMFNMSLSLIYTENSSKEQIISAEQTEMFFCNVNDISLENFSHIKRKTFMGNFSFRLRKVVTSTNNSIELAISKIIIKFSLKDVKALAIFLEDVEGKFDLLTDKTDEIKPSNQPSLDTSLVLSSQSFEILLINDTANRYFPIMYFNLEGIEDFRTTIGDIIDIDFGLKIFIRYFNLKISMWEPLLQHCSLQLKSRINRKQYAKSYFQIKPYGQKQQFVTIDISTNFIETVIKTSNDMELEFKSFDQGDDMNDSINTCIVSNYTGYEIECSCGEKPVIIDRDFKKELKIKSQKQQQQTIIDKSTMDVFLDIQIPATKLAIRKVNIKSEDVQRILIRDSKRHTSIIKVVKVDISKNIKYVLFISPVTLINSTCIDMAIRIQGVLQQIPFMSGSTISMPYDNFDAPIQILYQRSASDIIKTAQTIKLSRISVGNYRLNVKQIERQMSRRIIFQSPYKITSLLPLPLFMNFKIAQRYYSLSFSAFDPKQVVTETYFQSIEDSLVSIYVEAEDMLWTDFLPLNEGQRVLQDMFGNTFTINIKKINQEQENTESYIIYPTIVFLNKSEEKITFHNPTNRKMLAGQKTHSDNRSVLSSELTSIILSGQGNDMQTLPIKLPKQSIQFLMKLNKQIDGSPTKVNCLMSLKRSLIEIFDIRFTKYILKSQYYLHNHSNAELLVRHANAFMTETTKLAGGSGSNMYWFSQDYEKAIRITLNASNWEWSSPLNIDRAELTHFILRDRSNFRKVLFMTIQVNLVQEQRVVNLKILNNQDEYPFLLINESQDANIFVPSFKTTLTKGNQMFFSWDDPFKQFYQVEVVIQSANQDNSFKERTVYLKQKKVQNQIVDIKASKGLIRIEIDVVTRFSQKIFRFRNYIPAQTIKVQMTRYQISLPIAICLINNSGIKASNTMSLYTNLNLIYLATPENDRKQFDLTCDDLQIDNNTKMYVYFPVVLKSNFHIKGLGKKNAWLELQVDVGKIILRLEEDFVYEVYSIFLMLQNFMPPDEKASTFSISRIKLPKLDIQLQVQAKKLSIETPIELDQPAQTSYPWDAFPYPIKDIVLSLLSNLSVSPLSFISSLHEGVVGLFNDTNSSRGVQGFFTKIIQSIGNGINGMVRILVGDMERVDTFVDGVESGVSTCVRTTLSSLTTLYYEPDPIGLVKTLAGFVYKPITGVLQLTLKITEGIKNTTKFKFEISDFETRKRYPVMFWGNQHYYIEYNGVNSQILLMLQTFEGGKYKDINLVDIVYLRESQQQNSVIIVSTTFMIHISLETKKCFWAIPMNIIEHVKLRQQILAIQIFLKSELSYFNTKSPTILIQDGKLARKLVESIQQVLRQQRITN